MPILMQSCDGTGKCWSECLPQFEWCLRLLDEHYSEQLKEMAVLGQSGTGRDSKFQNGNAVRSSAPLPNMLFCKTATIFQVEMSMKTDRRLATPALLSVLMISAVAAQAQAVPCTAITRNPQVLEALIDTHASTEGTGSPSEDQTISAVDLQHLKFSPIVVQPGDALYVESRGKDFTITAQYANGDFAALDSSPKASDDQWRKGILPLDHFNPPFRQHLIKLAAAAHDPQKVFFRNINIIRAGRPMFEFAKLSSYGRPHVRNAPQIQLPSKAFVKTQSLPPPPIQPSHST